MNIRSFASKTIAFLLPPFLVGGLTVTQTVRDIMRHSEPKAISRKQDAPENRYPERRSLDPAKPTALFVLSAQGTEAMDLLGPWEVLGASGAFNLVAAAPERNPVATTGALGVLPDYSFAEAPAADILILPAVVDPMDQRLIQFVRARAPLAKEVVTFCEGARLAGFAGLLDGKQVATHFIAREDMIRDYPHTRFPLGHRWIRDGNLLSSAGVTGSLDAALALVAAHQGQASARAVAEKLGLTFSETGAATRDPGLHPGDRARLILNAGFDWGRKYFGVLVAPGVSELSLASWVDSIPRTLSSRVFTVASTRKFIPSRFGLILIPTDGLEDAFPPARFVTPSFPDAPGAVPDAAVAQWLKDYQVMSDDMRAEAPAKSLDRAFQRLSDEGAGSVTGVAARLMEYTPSIEIPTHSHDSKLYGFLVRALLLGALGLWGFTKASAMLKRGPTAPLS